MHDAAIVTGPLRLQLTPNETALVAALELDTVAIAGFDANRAHGERAAALMRSLIARRAIPEIRVRWFSDAELNPGSRGVSRQQVFERNGTTGEAIFRHASFRS